MESKPTETLEDYLAGDYHKDMDDIRELEDMLERAANVFVHACDDGRWPYEIVGGNGSGAGGPPDKVSHGTQAMIAAALSKMTGLGHLASDRPACISLRCKKDLETVTLRGIERLEQSLSEDKGLVSSSFGKDDPITLSHVADLWRGMKDSVGKEEIDGRKETLKAALDELRSLSIKDPAAEKSLLTKLPVFRTIQQDHRPPDGKEKAKGGKAPTYLRNAFVPLRIVRAVKDLETAGIDLLGKPDAKVAAPADGQIREPASADPKSDFNRNYKAFFEATLHQQLSFSSIPDSRFDPAELTFCLEGLMLCGRHVVDEELFERVLRVLQDKQADSAHWHPNKPIYATPQGLTMLPVSVEGAISLMRSVAMMDRQSAFQHVSVRAAPMAGRFWKWLRARIAKFEGPKDPPPLPAIENKERYKELLGWHSDHVNNPELIHLWDTSQVIEFMLAYRELLQRSVAGRSLMLSRLRINVPANGLPADWSQRWDAVVGEYEPRQGEATGQVYLELRKDFIEPWATKKSKKKYSILLYGPPGTGKSTLAENVAKMLGMRMLTVTVSDFLGSGGENVEARAKAVFQTLEAQFDTVILFDEIDSFLLDRDSKLYQKQSTLFQFLTPGMLTKINDLRKQKRSIFIIATNYANRIDPAIKRKGRIDAHYLLPLPNREQRLNIIKRETDSDIAIDKFPDELAEDSLFFGYSDLAGAIDDAGGKGASIEAVAKYIAQGREPSTSIESYLRRIGKEEMFPTDEFVGMIELKLEVDDKYNVADLINECNRAGLDKESQDALETALIGDKKDG